MFSIARKCLLLWQLGSVHFLLNYSYSSSAVIALSWNRVKPLFLVSMYALHTRLGAQQNRSPGQPFIFHVARTPIHAIPLASGPSAMNRIFGGNVAKPQCFPYQVGLLLQRPKGLYWCGGSLISDEFVLTAAHCVDKAKQALVFLGANEIKNPNESGQKRLMVSRKNFIIFPTWNSMRLKDDIALVRLPQTLQFTDRIQPIALPKRSYEYRNFRNKLAIASGWGRFARGVRAISGILRYVKLQIIDGKKCKQSFPLVYSSTNICTSGLHAKSTCNGDSGGPLVLRRRHSKKSVLIGITSFGSLHGCDRGYPAAFTKVASYLDWISDETGIELPQTTSNAVRFDDIISMQQQCYQHTN